MFKSLIQIILWVIPWSIRRVLLRWFFGYNIHPKAKIGKSIILAKELILKEYSSIGNFCFCKNIDRLVLGAYTNLGNFNYITGAPTGINTHFTSVPNRKCELIVGEQTGITSRHYFDCTAGIYIGNFCQIAGYGTTFLTHSIDCVKSRQDATSIRVGNYCFIGLKSTILKGVTIADKLVVGACSLVTKKIEDSEALYGGDPCKFIKKIENAQFFNRTKGAL